MMRKLLCILFLGMSTLLIAQTDYEIEWGKEFKRPRNHLMDEVVSVTDKEIISFHKVGREGEFISMDHDLKILQTEGIEFRFRGGKLNYFDVLEFETGEIYLMLNGNERDKRENNILFQEIDRESLRPKAQPEVLTSMKYKKGLFQGRGGYSMDMSDDDSKLLIYHDLPYNKDDGQQIYFKVYDHELELLWEDEYELPYLDSDFQVKDIEVNDQGHVFITGRLYERKERKGLFSYDFNYNYRILEITPESDMIEYKLDFDDYWIKNMKGSFTNDKIIVTGFYAHKSSKTTSLYSGCCFISFNRDNQELDVESFKEFDINFVNQDESSSTTKRNKKKSDKGKNVGISDIVFDEVINRDDGGMILIGERFWIDVVTTYHANGGSSTRYIYNYHDIIVVSISPEGDIEWANKIPKRQKTEGFFSYMSYSYAIVNNKLFFMYNDNAKNEGVEKARDLKYVTKSASSTVILVEMDQDGSFEKRVVYTAKEANMDTFPGKCVQISDQEILMYGIYKTEHKFGKIILDKE